MFSVAVTGVTYPYLPPKVPSLDPIPLDIATPSGVATPMLSFSRSFAFFGSAFAYGRLGAFSPDFLFFLVRVGKWFRETGFSLKVLSVNFSSSTF